MKSWATNTQQLVTIVRDPVRESDKGVCPRVRVISLGDLDAVEVLALLADAQRAIRASAGERTDS